MSHALHCKESLRLHFLVHFGISSNEWQSSQWHQSKDQWACLGHSSWKWLVSSLRLFFFLHSSSLRNRWSIGPTCRPLVHPWSTRHLFGQGDWINCSSKSFTHILHRSKSMTLNSVIIGKAFKAPIGKVFDSNRHHPTPIWVGGSNSGSKFVHESISRLLTCVIVFRVMELQISDFENAAFACFSALLVKTILHFDLNLYIPLSLVSFCCLFQRASDSHPSRWIRIWEQDKPKMASQPHLLTSESKFYPLLTPTSACFTRKLSHRLKTIGQWSQLIISSMDRWD